MQQSVVSSSTIRTAKI